MRVSNVKALHSRRDEIKERLVQWNANNRSKERQRELRESRAGSDGGRLALIATEFKCDVADPVVMEFLLELEEEVRVEQLVALYDESHSSDWEAYFRYHEGQGM